MTTAEQVPSSGAEQAPPSAAERMAALKETKKKELKDAALAGLTTESATYLVRLFELSPGHQREHGELEKCDCTFADMPRELSKDDWLHETCHQIEALSIKVQSDRISNSLLHQRYTPEPGFRLDILREAILLMAQGHTGGKRAWMELVRKLGIRQSTDEVAVIEAALTELRGVESPPMLRWPHGEKHPRRGLADKGAPGTVCDGKTCGGAMSADTEAMLAVFAADYRAHAARDTVYAVAKAGPQIGRAVMKVDGSQDSQFGSMLKHSGYEKLGQEPSASRVKGTASLIEGHAHRKVAATGATKHILAVRATTYDNGYLIDLGQGQYVEVDVDGWRVTDWKPEYPVMLATERPLPVPEPVQGEDPRLRHLGFTDGDSNWHQIRMWQATAFFADHERQLMMLTGGSGSGKTKRAQSIAAIVDPLDEDPHGRPVLGGPLPDDETLAPQLVRNYLFTSDNLTNLNDEDSDRLCRIATGYRFTRRALYTTADIYSVTVLRAGLMTGIDIPPQLREDAQNRLLHLELDVSATKRASGELDRERRDIGGQMLGALLDDMVTVLRAYQRGEYEAHDRFPIVACAARAFGPEYVDSRAGRQRELARQRAEGDTQLAAVAKVVKYAGVGPNPTLRLTANELYEAVLSTLDDGRAPKGWSTTPHALVRRMGSNLGTLQAFGITRELDRTKTERWTELVYTPGAEKAPVPAPPPDSICDVGQRTRERGPFRSENAYGVYERVQELTIARQPAAAKPRIRQDPPSEE